MTAAEDTYRLLGAFVDELARCGMRVACTAPGSRSAPLVLSLVGEPRLRCCSHVDERCAGFFALGAAKASGLPVAVACTSGTAAAELLPAAIEAREARVPLLLLTADRPAELRENGAGQAIDQLKLFGAAAKWFFEVGVHDADPERVRWMRTLACRAYWTALEGRPGVVHLNFPLREPLTLAGQAPTPTGGRPGQEPYVRRAPASGAGALASTSLVAGVSSVPVAGTDAGAAQALLERHLARARRGVIVAGREERRPELPAVLAGLAKRLGWPLLADPLSGARRGEAAIAHYDALLRSQRFAAAHAPDLVLRVGDLPVSKPLRGWLEGLGETPQIALDLEGAWQDPAAVVSHSLALDPVAALARIALDPDRGAGQPDRGAGQPDRGGGRDDRGEAHDDGDEGRREDPGSAWLGGWRSADERAAEAILGVLGGELSEPVVAAELGALLPPQATLFVASSMPVRDIETFWPARGDPPRVLCNRGANGIDGTVSSAFGAAAASDGPTVLLIGDVALAYDLGGLLAATRLGLSLTIVLLDNDGGGIFDFLPVAGAALARADDPDAGAGEPPDSAPDVARGAGAPRDVYTRHVATPPGLDFGAAAAVYGVRHEPVASVPELRDALERALSPGRGSTLVHVHTDRAANVRLHRRVWAAVGEALDG